MANVKYKLRKEDLVQVIAGKDRGKQGKILKIDHEKGRVIVSGINMVKKAMKKKSQTTGVVLWKSRHRFTFRM